MTSPPDTAPVAAVKSAVGGPIIGISASMFDSPIYS